MRHSVEASLFSQDDDINVLAEAKAGSKRRLRSGARNWHADCASFMDAQELPKRDQLLMPIVAAKTEACFGAGKIRVPG